MKRLLLSIFILFGIQFSVLAHEDDQVPLDGQVDAMAPPPVAEQNRWLYELLMAPTDRTQQPKESFKSFWVHLLDSYDTFIHPDEVKAANLRLRPNVKGTIRYVIIRKRYEYDIIQRGEKAFTIAVRVHLKNPKNDDIANFTRKIKQAESTWNWHKVRADFDYNFQFDIVTDRRQAHFSVNVLDETRGPYDTNWSRGWNSAVIAHEIGHMLGLGDEYETISGKINCLTASLMCSSWSGRLMPHHYYFVLRRLMVAP